MKSTVAAFAFAASALAGASPVEAAQVSVYGQGYLDQATGAHSVGEFFKFSFSYDDQEKPTETFQPGFYGYSTGSPISFTVGDQSYVDEILYYLEYSSVSKELSFGPPGDYGGPRAFIDIATDRVDSSAALPTADQLNDKAGTFRFEIHGLPGYASSGSGLFVAAVPEPATWGMMILGIGATGLTLRRRQKISTRNSFA